MAYERIAGPLGPKRMDIAAALIAAVIANANRPSKSQAFSIDDFLPEWQRSSQEEMTPDQVWSAVQQAQAAFSLNGR